MKEDINVIEGLRKIFRITVAAFDFAELIGEQFGKSSDIDPKTSCMKSLHKNILEELNKEYPDMNQINHYLKSMEDVADKSPPKYRKGSK